mmetsp:Transcript_22039/g.54454  ORF Transcript_22039/g.54454 Transcript_22039/m.54454 type:complete len:465 (-) Transcript_22039:89-1483(-)
MGITFRSGGYTRFVRIGGRTIKDGEAAAIWNRCGEHRQIIGPKRIRMFYSTIRFLTRFKAEADQYLKIQHRDGTVEHIQGPVQMYLNPSYHDTISVKDGIKLKENEVIKVSHLPMLQNNDIAYNADGTAVEKDESLVVKKSKRFVLGPTLFIPSEDELVEEFEWSALPDQLDFTSQLGSGREGLIKFKKVQLHSTRVWSVSVPIGSESAKVHAALAITYKIDSIDKVRMHKDPCASICAALMGDIQDLFSENLQTVTSAADFRSIQTKVAHKMSGSKSFPNLIGTGESIGFSIDSIQVLEVTPGRRMQKQLTTEHEREMRMNTQIANKESEIKFQELELEERRKKMENEVELTRKEAKMQAELAEELHMQKMAALNQEQEMAKMRKQERLDSLKASDELVLNFLGNLKELGVDMSTYLCTEAGNKAAKKIIYRAPSLATSSDPATTTFTDVEEKKEWNLNMKLL